MLFLALWGLLAEASGLADLLPGDPVLSPAQRASYDASTPASVHYSGPPRVEFPVLPIQVFGVRYALDVVISTTNPDWDMHEYARVDLPSGPLWLAKDATAQKVQSIVAPIEDIAGWVPEVPVVRYNRPLEVVDHSAGNRVDLQFRYQNPRDQAVEVHAVGTLPTRPSPHRNGNTMGHSRDSVAVLLDLHLFGPLRQVDMSIDGVKQKIKRIFGLYPMKILLAQTQGGFAIADALLQGTPEGFRLQRPGSDAPWPTHSEESWAYTDGWARTNNPVSSTGYHYTQGELDRAEVWQAGQPVPVTGVVFQPSVPDLRRPFPGTVESSFVVDIAGQQAHGTGRLVSQWVSEDTVQVDMVPEAPAWFANRPIRTTLRYTSEGVYMKSVRL